MKYFVNKRGVLAPKGSGVDESRETAHGGVGGAEEGMKFGIGVALDNLYTAPEIQAELCPRLKETVINAHGGGKQIPSGLLYFLTGQIKKMFLQGADQIGEQIVFIFEILVKTAPGNVSILDDLVDGYLGEANPGEFFPGGIN